MKKVVLSLALVAMMFVSCKENNAETPVEETAVEAVEAVEATTEEAAEAIEVAADSATTAVEEATETPAETPAK